MTPYYTRVQTARDIAFHTIFKTKVTVGTGPKQVVDLLADTGSSWLWVDTCMFSDCQSTPGFFDPALSSTTQCTNDQHKIVYGSMTVNG